MKNYQTILVAVDFSTGSRAALEQARRLAKAHQATLHVLHIVNEAALAAQAGNRMASREVQEQNAVASARAALLRWMELSGVTADCGITIVAGTPLHEILEQVRFLRADLLVAGISGAGESPAGAGSVSGKLARKSPCHVLLVNAGHPHAFRKIVAGIDYSEAAHEVAAAAHRLALQDGASLDFVHVWQHSWADVPYVMPFGDTGVPLPVVTPEERELHATNLRRQLEEFAGEAARGISSAAVVLESGSHGHALAEHAEAAGADLIIVGGKGRTNLRYVLLGSTAERLLTKLPCSLLVIKPPQT